MGVTVQQGYTASSSSGGGLTLIGTITTTSGTTQALTSIPNTYKSLRLVFKGVSASSSYGLTLALSSTNGAAYGAAAALTTAGGTNSARSYYGTVDIDVYTAAVTGKIAKVALVQDTGGISGSTATLAVLTNTAAACVALRVGTDAGTLDAGTVEVYGVN